MLGELAAVLLLAAAAPQPPAAPERPHAEPAPTAPSAPAPVALEPAAPAAGPGPSAAPAEKRARHATASEQTAPEKAQGTKVEGPLPPALTASALREELAAAARKRQDEIAAMQAERARLEKVQAEIEGARSALRNETAQLEARVKKANELSPRPGTKSADPPAAAGAEAVARAMKGMKTEQAAAVLVRLDPPLAVAALRKMRPADVSAVLDRLKPETAAEFLSLMAGSQLARGGSR